MKYFLSLVSTVLAFGVASAADPTATIKEFKESFGIAQVAVTAPSGQLVRARVEGPPMAPKFGFYFYVEGRLVEVEVKQKRVIKHTQKSGDEVTNDVASLIQKKQAGKTKLPDGRLFEIAETTLRDTPFSNIEYQKVGNNLVMQVGDLTIDAETGKTISK